MIFTAQKDHCAPESFITAEVRHCAPALVGKLVLMDSVPERHMSQQRADTGMWLYEAS